LHLQLEILRIDPRHHIAGTHGIADIDVAGDDLAGHAEAEIGLAARPHHPDELMARVARLEGHPLDLDRALGLGDRGGRLVSASREQGKQGQRSKRP
jgi:hypothetical protein